MIAFAQALVAVMLLALAVMVVALVATNVVQMWREIFR